MDTMNTNKTQHYLKSIEGKPVTNEIAQQLMHLLSEQKLKLLANLSGPESFVPSGKMPDNSDDVIKVIYLDTETTGLEVTDEIVQLSMVKALVNKKDGSVIQVEGYYNSYQEPAASLSDETWANMKKLSGIVPEMLTGQTINQFEVSAFLHDVDLIVAHKANFDRPMMENNLTEITDLIKSKAWACSLSEIPWADYGFSNSKLDYLLFRVGYAYEAHRADIDTLALMQLMDSEIEVDGQVIKPMKVLYDYSVMATVKVWATSAPFDAKDLLKTRGYAWHDGSNAGDHKAWAITLPENKLNLELDYLNREIYRRVVSLPVDKMTALQRHSDPLSPRKAKPAARSFIA